MWFRSMCIWCSCCCYCCCYRRLSNPFWVAETGGCGAPAYGSCSGSIRATAVRQLIATRPPSSDESWAPFLPAPLAKPHVCGIRVFYSCFSASKWSRATRATLTCTRTAHRSTCRSSKCPCSSCLRLEIPGISMQWKGEVRAAEFGVSFLDRRRRLLRIRCRNFSRGVESIGKHCNCFLGTSFSVFITIQVDYCTGIYVWFGNF